MTQSDEPSTQLREPLYRAADLMDKAADEFASGAPAASAVRHAIRTGVAAIERHMDAVQGTQGMADDISGKHPRLMGALEHLEAIHAQLLVDLWEARRAEGDIADGAAFAERLRRLARQMRHAADQEVDLLYESLNEPMAMD